MKSEPYLFVKDLITSVIIRSIAISKCCIVLEFEHFARFSNALFGVYREVVVVKVTTPRVSLTESLAGEIAFEQYGNLVPASAITLFDEESEEGERNG